jgi:hypothetical protein
VPVGNGASVGMGKPPVGKGKDGCSVAVGIALPTEVGAGSAESTSEKLGRALSWRFGRAVGASW